MWCWRRLLRAPHTSGRSNQSILKEINPGGSGGKESACNVGDLGSIPGLGRSPGEGNGYTLPVCPPNVTQISIFDCPHRWYKRPMIGPSIETKTGGNVGLPGLAGSQDLDFSFTWNGVIPRPHQVTWSQPINMHLARKREPIRGKLKSPRMPKLEKSPWRFGPKRLLCKHVTNPLRPATNCLCTPYKLGNSLGSALSGPVPLRWTRGGSPDSSQQ